MSFEENYNELYKLYNGLSFCSRYVRDEYRNDYKEVIEKLHDALQTLHLHILRAEINDAKVRAIKE